MTYKVNWRVTIPSNIDDQTYKGKIHVSTSDGAVSIIPVTVVALNEEKKVDEEKEDIYKDQSEGDQNNHEDSQEDENQQFLGIRGLSEKKLDFDVFIS
ncbi:subtilisin-like serine protease [Cryptosporidium bovis]|uniref:subtilisin-like serine protease n=1 Tax=Cryptosporidium bovis TaxID=310047 RepID=UPI00351A358B|nr:subtilisin-like serine protease [Cryptosporidium bovis]